MNRVRRAIGAAILSGALLVVPRIASAVPVDDLVLYPIDPASVTPSFDVSDPFEFAMLTLGVTYDYELLFMGSESGDFQNLPGEILNWQGKLTFNGFPPGFEGGPNDLVTLTLLGFFQTGAFTEQTRADVGFVLSSFTDVGSGDPLDAIYVTDGTPGQIAAVFGSTFLAFQFPAIPGAMYTFGYQTELKESLTDPLNFSQPQTAFVPEPGTGVLLALGLVGVALFGRRARSNRTTLV